MTDEMRRFWTEDNREWYEEKASPILRLYIGRVLRHRVGMALRGKARASKTKQLLGCSVDDLREHLEKKFTRGMHWGNYGAWHIDHIRPCASFDLTDPEQQKVCFHFSNLQPLWAAENVSKGAKWKEAQSV